jgi:glycosyltransferase involved in cell wall biosynthesis
MVSPTSGSLPPEPLLSVLVPVYNEESTVRALVARVCEVPLPVRREIIVINDGSTDATRAVLDGLVPRDDLRVVHASANGGKGRAIRLGLQHARGDIVAIQDADLELDPAQLGALVEPILRDESGVVYGSRFLAGRPPAPAATILANRFLTLLTNLIYSSRLTDMETCYKVMRSDIARSLDLMADRFDIEPEITAKLLRAGHRIVEVPVRFEPRSRAAGKKIGWRDGVQAIRTLVRLRLRP